ncbi:hypothetical protein HJC23_000818 [Cyclotella cryptica]|uniref:peptidylprolyl isomerase n=1 Tax=Cyclotella cryptica TaxID=29204 RepID=A0ABD3Q5Q6_9STRA|eukprot:CCRYP_008460-RA/>CCRYP_008460-RA protein AED:0.30 eAED:0.30 QI:0/-1/0/1/-1/1/1/0/219
MLRFASLFVTFLTASAFAPPTRSPHSQLKQLHQMFSSEAPPLQTVDDDAANSDPFESYDPSPSQKTIGTKDVSLGSGSTVLDASSSSSSQLLQIQYSAKLLNSKFTANLKQFETPSMVFQTGEQRILPGLEEGIIGMKVGGRRLVRVPPNKGYGDKWYRGVVPPDSHLEFDVTVVQVAEGPLDEFKMKLEQFGVERAVGAAVCLGYLALSPLLEKSGVL